MNNLQLKINYLKWLKLIGVDYFCSNYPNKGSLLMQRLSNNKTNISTKTNSKLIKKQESDIKENQLMNKILKSSVKKEIKTLDATIQSESRILANQATNVLELKKIISTFSGCSLKNFATNTVFADGIDSAKILLVGEAPGATEDQQGIPFCGESGQLLDKMLATIGLSREKNIYITNTSFWRPPANRRPTFEEIEICKPFVEKHIALIKPELIILIGSTAVFSLLGKSDSMSSVKKNTYYYTNQYLNKAIYTTALFHPAYLLRMPIQKKETWFDLLKIKEYIEQNNLI